MLDAVFPRLFEEWLQVTRLDRVELTRLVDRMAAERESDRAEQDAARAVALGRYPAAADAVPALLLDAINEYAERIRRDAVDGMRSSVELRHATDALIASATQVLRVLPFPAERPAGEDQRSPLTDREREILSLIANALSNRQIAVALRISEKTVKNHITSLFTKLGVSARAEAIVVALRHGPPAPGHPASH